MRAFILALGLVAFPAGAASPSDTRVLTASERKAVSDAVGQRLKDPASATFKYPPAIRGKTSYCGFFNAKNSYGGYVGFKPFFAVISNDPKTPYAAVMYLPDENPGSALSRLTVQRCEEEGYDLVALEASL